MKRQYCGQYCFFNRYNLSLIVYEDTLCGLLKNTFTFIEHSRLNLFIYRIWWTEYRKFPPYFSINIVKRYASTINKQNYTHLLIAAHYYTQNLFETSERDWHFVYRLNNILLNSPPEKKKKKEKRKENKRNFKFQSHPIPNTERSNEPSFSISGTISTLHQKKNAQVKEKKGEESGEN